MREYPIAVFEDRYMGTYSGGEWIAVAECDKQEVPGTRFEIAFSGTHGSDPEAATFGVMITIIPWIAVGNTPNEAVENIRFKYSQHTKENAL